MDATIRTGSLLHPFRVPFPAWPVTQGGAPGFALRSALGYFILPFQGSGNVQSPGSSSTEEESRGFLAKFPVAWTGQGHLLGLVGTLQETLNVKMNALF